MITRFNPPFRSQVPPQWRGACAAVAGGGPNRATAIVVARLVFTISGQSRASTALRLIDIVTAVHSHLNELATLEFGLQQLARLENELAPDGAVPGPLMLALSSRTRIGTVDRANAIAAATLPAEPLIGADAGYGAEEHQKDDDRLVVDRPFGKIEARHHLPPIAVFSGCL